MELYNGQTYEKKRRLQAVSYKLQEEISMTDSSIYLKNCFPDRNGIYFTRFCREYFEVKRIRASFCFPLYRAIDS